MAASPNPVDLLTNKQDRQLTYLSDKVNPITWGLAGFACVCFMNWATRKPVLAGIQRHAIFSTIGVGGALYFDKKRDAHLAERDAVLRHYLELHSEDFPNPERKKWSEIIAPWVPIR